MAALRCARSRAYPGGECEVRDLGGKPLAVTDGHDTFFLNISDKHPLWEN
jgi:hypothetical protein